MKAKYLTAADAFDRWQTAVLTGEKPVLWQCGSGGLDRIEIGPGRVLLLGGAPGAGKTALTMQLVVDGLRMNPSLRCFVCNVEMAADCLLDRQLARLSGVPLDAVQSREFDADHGDRIDQALRTIEGVADRLAFCRPPFSLENIAAGADAFHADLIVIDYAQRIIPPGRHADTRSAVNSLMNYLRQFADAGCGLICCAAVGRTRDKQGRSSYDGDGLNLASFRESSELEFGADDCYILAPDAECPYDAAAVKAKHLKARHARPKDLDLTFHGSTQRFTVAADPTIWDPSRTPLADTLRDAWDATPPADDDGGDPWT